MVLSDGNFATIVRTVEEDRRIYDNIRKDIQFLLGSNLSEVIAIFIATPLAFPILENEMPEESSRSRTWEHPARFSSCRVFAICFRTVCSA